MRNLCLTWFEVSALRVYEMFSYAVLNCISREVIYGSNRKLAFAFERGLVFWH